METAAEHPQPSVASEQVLELATTANGPIEHGSDALQAQLSQTQPELEHLRRSRALQSGLAAVAAPPAWLHIGKTGGEGGAEGCGGGQQQKRGGLGDPQQLLGIHGDRIR